MTETELRKMALRIALDDETEDDVKFIKECKDLHLLLKLADYVQEFCPNWNYMRKEGAR